MSAFWASRRAKALCLVGILERLGSLVVVVVEKKWRWRNKENKLLENMALERGLCHGFFAVLGSVDPSFFRFWKPCLQKMEDLSLRGSHLRPSTVPPAHS